MRSSDVTFRSAVIDESAPVDKRVEREIIEVRYPGGNVAAFPATDIDPSSGARWCDLYGMKYKAFKDGEPDPDRVAELEGKIAGHQAELDALHATKKDRKKAEPPAGDGARLDPNYHGDFPGRSGAKPGTTAAVPSAPGPMPGPTPTLTPPDLRVDHGLGGPAYIPPPARTPEKAPV